MIDYIHIDYVLIEDGQLPQKQHENDACYDMFSRITTIIPSMKWAKIPLGVAMHFHDSYVGIIKGRSGLTSKGIVVPTGTIDPNYTGELCAVVYNFTDFPFDVSKGDRICQFCLTNRNILAFNKVDSIVDTERGSNGFGSTGIN